MKRWWHWVLAAVAVAAVAFVIAVFVMPTAPYAFLRGKPQVGMNMSAQDLREINQMGMDLAMYSFPGRFEEVKAEADHELKSLGYTDFGSVMGEPGKTKQAMYVTASFVSGMSSAFSSSSSGK